MISHLCAITNFLIAPVCHLNSGASLERYDSLIKWRMHVSNDVLSGRLCIMFGDSFCGTKRNLLVNAPGLQFKFAEKEMPLLMKNVNSHLGEIAG